MKKLTEEQIKQLPELLKEKTQADIAILWGVSKQTLSYWVKQFRKNGVVIENIKQVGLINKIIKEGNYDTSTKISGE